MARITVEDCLGKIDNRFRLIHLAAKRVRQLRKGEDPLVDSKNTDIVVALREIAAGKVYEVENSGEQHDLSGNKEDQDPENEIIPKYVAEGSTSDEITEQEEGASVEK